MDGVLETLPGVRLLLRGHLEGTNVAQMLKSYDRWSNLLSGYSYGGLTAWAYEVANEPNHPNHKLDADTWSDAVDSALSRGLGTSPLLPLCSPGLTPHVQIPKWRDAIQQFAWAWDYSGSHIYFQSDGPLAGIAAGLDQVPARRVGPMLIVTEINCGAPWQPGGTNPQDRALLCTGAIKLLRGDGVGGAVLFAHDSNGDPAWDPYIYAPDVQSGVLGIDAPFVAPETNCSEKSEPGEDE